MFFSQDICPGKNVFCYQEEKKMNRKKKRKFKKKEQRKKKQMSAADQTVDTLKKALTIIEDALDNPDSFNKHRFWRHFEALPFNNVFEGKLFSARSWTESPRFGTLKETIEEFNRCDPKKDEWPTARVRSLFTSNTTRYRVDFVAWLGHCVGKHGDRVLANLKTNITSRKSGSGVRSRPSVANTRKRCAALAFDAPVADAEAEAFTDDSSSADMPHADGDDSATDEEDEEQDQPPLKRNRLISNPYPPREGDADGIIRSPEQDLKAELERAARKYASRLNVDLDQRVKTLTWKLEQQTSRCQDMDAREHAQRELLNRTALRCHDLARELNEATQRAEEAEKLLAAERAKIEGIRRTLGLLPPSSE
jgi:hypothetical protein